MTNLKIDQIGAERSYTILTNKQKFNVIKYLFDKYYGEYARVIIQGLRNEEYQIIDPIINLFLSYVFPSGLLQFAKQFIMSNPPLIDTI